MHISFFKMQKLVLIASLMSILGCVTLKPNLYYRTDLPYTESEANLIAIIEYFKNKLNQQCKGDCNFRVESHLSYFDTCSVYFLNPIKFNKSFFKKKIIIPEGDYHIANIGTIKVSHFMDDKNTDFKFSPLYHNKNDNTLNGQVKYLDGRQAEYACNIILHEVIFQSTSYYYDDCSMDFESF